MKTKLLFISLSVSLFFTVSCKKDTEPIIVTGSGQYEYFTDTKTPISGPLTPPDRTFYVDTEIEDLKNKIKDEIGELEGVSRNMVSLTKLNLRSATVFPELTIGETPAYLALTESQFRVKSIDANLETSYIKLGLFNFENSSDSILTYEILDEDLLALNPYGFAPFDFEFTWNELLETYEIQSDIEIIFDYEYEVEK